MSKREKSFKIKIQKVQKIMEDLQREYDALPKDKQWGWRLQSRISAKVQLELCMSERTAKGYIDLVKANERYFNSSKI